MHNFRVGWWMKIVQHVPHCWLFEAGSIVMFGDSVTGKGGPVM